MRYKEFNNNRVLEQCLVLFWQNGFRGSSINEIVAATGVNRFSLYTEFTDKEGILYNTIDLYYDRYASKRLELLQPGKPIREVLEAFYWSYLTQDEHQPLGCFIIHIATELADSNKVVKTRLDQYLKELSEQMASLLEEDPETAANKKFLTNQLVGFFCSTMCFCVIGTPEERQQFIRNGIHVILLKNTLHATET